MVKAIFFDFYNTLGLFWPPVDEIQHASCSELGLPVTKAGIRAGYEAADEFMGKENAQKPLTERSQEERDRFFVSYERIILQGAGVDASPGLAEKIWQLARQIPEGFDLYDDALPTLKKLKERGIVTGVISNLRWDMSEVSHQLGLDGYLQVFVNGEDVGADKPRPPIFLAALERAQVGPEEAAHVGDQYHVDVMGAKAVGIKPVLLDRNNRYRKVNDCTRIRTLLDLDKLLAKGQL